MYEEYDYRVYRAIIDECKKKGKIKMLLTKLNTAEAFNFGYGGAKTKKGYQSFSKWQKKIINEINRLNGISVPTFWETKKRKSLKF